MKIIILAGGFATRLWPITENTAKPLIKVAGKEIISYIVEKIPSDIEVIISTNNIFKDDFYKWRSNSNFKNVDIFIEDSDQEKSKKGALFAVSLVIQERKINEDVLVIAGDNLFFFDFEKAFDKFGDIPMLATYDVKHKNIARQFGVVVPKKNHMIAEFQEKPDNPKSTLVSTGFLFFPEKYLEFIINYAEKNNDDLGGVFEFLLKKEHAIGYFDFTEKWFDIGSFNALLESQKYIIGNKIIDKRLNKDENVSLLGSIFLSKTAVVKNSILENVIIMDDSFIENCSLRNTIVGKNVKLLNIHVSKTALRDNTFLYNI